VLLNLKPANTTSEYNRSVCLPITRLEVTKFITEWIADELKHQKKVLWLYGLAGWGKSTLLTTIAENNARLPSSRGFNRDISDRNFATLIRTLAYQLALFDPRVGAEISRVVESSPNITGMSLDFQFASLLTAKVFQSVQWLGGPIVLVIDALDECGSAKDCKILLQALRKGFPDLPLLMWVMAVSRQETDIENTLASHSCATVLP
jgi:hypothetical protein